MKNGNKTAVIVLAAGKGTRMESDKAKVLHELDDKPMIRYVIDASAPVAGENVIVVVGHQADAVKDTLSGLDGVSFALQEQQLGTGHAVKCAVSHIREDVETVVILCGDVPLIRTDTISKLIASHSGSSCAVTVLAVEVDSPTGYGRIVMDDSGQVRRIVEESDASAEEKKISTINSGIYCVERNFLEYALGNIGSDNAQSEFYITDIVEIASLGGRGVGLFVGSDSAEVSGVNTIGDLESVHRLLHRRLRELS